MKLLKNYRTWAKIKWIFRLTCSIATIVIASTISLVGEEYLSREEALKLAFPNADSFKIHRMIATKDQRAQLSEKLNVRLPSRFFKYYKVERNGELIGRAIAEEADGKYHPFEYLLSVDKDNKIRTVEVMNYHEKYGFEVKQETFTKQFKGLNVSNMKKTAKDIRIISGATISCRSLIESVKRQLVYLDVMVDFVSEHKPQSSVDHSNTVKGDSKSQLTNNSVIYRRRSQLLMGTLLEIQAYGESTEKVDQVINLAFQEVNRIEQILSTYQPNSEISKLNQLADKAPVTLSKEVIDLLVRSKKLTSQTNGSFDISVGPVVNLWRISEGKKPSSKSIEHSLQSIGMKYVEINVARQEVRFNKKGMRIDLGAIGKGYAMDRAAELLGSRGIHRAMLSFGGHILALNPPPGQQGWKVHIRNPKNQNQVIGHFEIKDSSVATTADDQRSYLVNGKRFSHIINPNTGQPVSGSSSVTIITPHAEQGDALSTALFAMGTDNSVQYGKEHFLQTLIIDEQGDLLTSPIGFVMSESKRLY